MIYLGSSAHIAPSFVYPNVTYLDNNDSVKDFFSDKSVVTEFVERRKKYERKVNISFVDLDYTKCEYHNKHDLIIAIFSPGSFTSAEKFMKKNSLFLYLSLPSEKDIHRNFYGLERLGEIQLVKGKYRYTSKMIENAYSKKDMIDNKFQDVYAYSVWKNC